MPYYLGIDIGTSASKGVLIDAECRIVAQASCQHETENPQDGWYQHDTEAIWWGDFCRLSRSIWRTIWSMTLVYGQGHSSSPEPTASAPGPIQQVR